MKTLKIAIQKKGRLSEKSLNLLNQCGLKVNNHDRRLMAKVKNFPVEVLFLRDDDIPQYVEQGVADIGILGYNEVAEKDKDVNIIEQLGFAGCRMSLALPKDKEYSELSDFEGKTIATSYPNILEKYFAEKDINVNIEEIGGSVEIATGIGLADGIFDIVSTGSTLIMNGLKEVEVVMKSEAVLIANKNLNVDAQEILDKLLFRMSASRKGKEYKYILMNCPNENVAKICKILPGMKSPTVLPLADGGWSSIHSVVKDDQFWEVIDELKNYGAEGILVAPIEKMIV